ncbi:hypothetical protein, partial [Rhodococcus qingshengii]|uniref:hypothetical protein n=1 Tax=Rhodococcus qingshengii TaxID=334542 RepID=UPI00287FCA4A
AGRITTQQPATYQPPRTVQTTGSISNAYRRTLRATTPTWLPTTNSPLTRNQLKELITSINTRRNLITTLDDSDTKTNNSTHRTRRTTRNAHHHAHPPRPNHHPAEMTRYSPSTSRAIRRKYSRE